MLGVIAVFTANLQLARTRAVNSDGAGQALQAWDMLHGNLLLHGWSLGDVSYYTTELPQYMLVEFVRGLNQDVVHVAAAMTYTLAMLLAALLAKGDSTGRQALGRVLIAVGIMLAPQLASGVNILLSSPDHIGTSVPVMVVWLILDHAPAPAGMSRSSPGRSLAGQWWRTSLVLSSGCCRSREYARSASARPWPSSGSRWRRSGMTWLSALPPSPERRRLCWRCTSSTPAAGFTCRRPPRSSPKRHDPGPQPGHHRPGVPAPGRRRLPRAPPDGQYRLHDAARGWRIPGGMGDVRWRRGASCGTAIWSLSCSSRAWPSTWPPTCSAPRPT